MNKRQEKKCKKMFNKVKKICVKVARFGAKLDKHNVPFEISYKNDTQLKKDKGVEQYFQEVINGNNS